LLDTYIVFVSIRYFESIWVWWYYLFAFIAFNVPP